MSKAYSRRVQVDREFQRKTDQLVRESIGAYDVEEVDELIEIDGDTVEVIKNAKGGDATKVINLVKSIERRAEEESGDPGLVAMAERAKAVKERFEQRQESTAEALAELLEEVENNQQRERERVAKGFDGLTYFVYRTLLDAGISDADGVSRKIKAAFVEYPNWMRSESELRELRKRVTFALYAEIDEIDRVASLVDELFTLLEQAERT